jgi:hypothetical protein
MRRAALVRLCVGLSIGLGTFASVSRGGSVKTTQDNPDVSVFSTGGFMNVAAYSDEDGLGKNNTVTPDVVFGGVPATAPAQYKTGVGLTSQTILVTKGRLFLGPVAQNIGPSGLALTKNKLTAIGDTDTITSQTGGWIGKGRRR